MNRICDIHFSDNTIEWPVVFLNGARYHSCKVLNRILLFLELLDNVMHTKFTSFNFKGQTCTYRPSNLIVTRET